MKPGNVRIEIRDASNRTVRTLYEGSLGTGDWVFDWDGKLADGTALTPGVYDICLLSEGRIQRKPLNLTSVTKP